MGIEVIGISRDLAPSQQEFKTKVGAKNHFLSDPDLTVTRRYGAVRDDLGRRRRQPATTSLSTRTVR